MDITKPIVWIPAGVGLAGAAAIAFWLLSPPPAVVERVPGLDNESNAATAADSWEGKLVKGPGQPADIPGSWPQFRGPNRDNICTDPTPLARSWPESGPKVLWEVDVGEGFAAPAVWNGRVYLMDYDRENQADALRCLSLADGREIWRYTYPVRIKRDHGMSRTIPAVTEQCVIALGPKCHLIAVNPLSGELLWKKNLVKEYDVEVPPWYAGQCPLIDNGRLILGTGGKHLLVALDALTGKLIWATPNTNRWQMTHSSVAVTEFKGRRIYVYCASGGVAGVAASDGQLLWQTPEWRISIANVPTPLPVGDGRIFLSGGYNAGSMMLQMKEKDGGVAVETLFRLKASVFGATQQTPIFHLNHIFGVRPDGQLVCLDLNGQIIWESGPANKFGSGPFLIAHDLFYLMNDEGVLTMAEVSTSGYKQLARAKVLSGHDSWGPMALVNGRLLVRDTGKLACLLVGASN